ncbi:Zn(II)2Cys6 transcription factor domain-containing protein [Aspergillus vadensis CBS 113365]|uniref:C6 transcription factor n=1 Tax=Aspergillus vadensis (strain CBS 113365 / IMI 142717 / IBT 24658) TaxID=1448311 RepID=A0A319CH49_ASPVC|nr:C6 transcription factor [Aspergillus vadensis CBS 113365]PYH67582.1 C6 transcription factor [Aspergillus vadensis CBS 113365]
MVYRGKPSKSCQQCRKRNIKCDKKEAGCSQCARACLTCSGYQKPTDIVILNETSTTAEKVLRKRSSDRPVSAGPLSTNLLPTVLQRAKHLYISQYVQDTPATGIYSYMQVFYPSKSDDYPLLETMINALFMATFSWLQGYPPALYYARNSYGSALSLTRKAIQSRKEALLDRTLFSVLLMSIFERLADVEQRGSCIRNGHLKGAIELMALRGDGQFTDDGGAKMFLHLTELVVLDCLANEVDIPLQFLALRQQALEAGADTSSPRWRFLEIMVRYAQLEYTARSSISAEDIIHKAKVLDEDLDRLSSYLPSFLSRRQIPEPPSIPSTKPDIYPDYNTQRCWNNIRVLRVQLMKIIREQCARVLGHSANDTWAMAELHESNRRVHSLATDICLSIPGTGANSRLPYEVSNIQSATLLFHLYVAKELLPNPAQLRLSIHERLQFVKEKQAPSQHKTLKHLLHDGYQKPRNTWEMWLSIGREDFSI